MSDTCIPFSAPTDMTAFVDKYKNLASNLGNNCAIFSGLSDLMPDMPTLGKDLKEMLATVTEAAGKLYDQISAIGAGITAAGMVVINQLTAALNTAMDMIQTAIDNISKMVDMALNAVKMASCPLLLNAIKSMPADIANAAASTGSVKAYEFAKGLDGKNVIGKFDIDNLARDALGKYNVDGVTIGGVVNDLMSLKSQAQGYLNQAANIAQFKCIPSL